MLYLLWHNRGRSGPHSSFNLTFLFYARGCFCSQPPVNWQERQDYRCELGRWPATPHGGALKDKVLSRTSRYRGKDSLRESGGIRSVRARSPARTRQESISGKGQLCMAGKEGKVGTGEAVSPSVSVWQQYQA